MPEAIPPIAGALPLDLAPEVAEALAAARPVVALESTILAHGLPWPDNLKTAHAVEGDVRAAGATPATIAVLGGRLRVGLSAEELEQVACTRTIAKLSSADLAACLAQGGSGATTVAATMIAAHAAGIAVFATGGIGGVHPGAGESFDVSADLLELARTPVAVVAAGAKAILDLPATLEVLETHGVPVIAVGQEAFPAFWSRDSGLLAPLRMDDPHKIARTLRLRRALGQPGGALIALPAPIEAAIPRDTLAPWIATAQADARAAGIAGKALTPFLLRRISELSEGLTLTANIALVRHNARFAVALAHALPG